MKIHEKAKNGAEIAWTWVLRLITLFLCTELVIVLLVIGNFGEDKLVYAVLPALLCACGSAFLVFKQLDQIIAKKTVDIEDQLIDDDKPNLDHFR